MISAVAVFVDYVGVLLNVVCSLSIGVSYICVVLDVFFYGLYLSFVM